MEVLGTLLYDTCIVDPKNAQYVTVNLALA
jgi:hypothetical protein